MINILNDPHYMPLIFAFLMYLSGVIYAILDGYDLGIGILLANAKNEEKDTMIATISPFWDANETWLVLTIGILLVAFPYAHGAILTSVYIPLTIMLIALIIRGVAFDFRVKVDTKHKEQWNNAFFMGSLIASLSQGYMLGYYIVEFEQTFLKIIFTIITSITLTICYMLIGSTWLIIKTEHELQKKAIDWAKKLLLILLPLIIVTLIMYPFNKHFTPHYAPTNKNIVLIGLLITISSIILLNYFFIKRLPLKEDAFCWLPFVITGLMFIFCAIGIAYSFYPYIIPNSMTLWKAASDVKSLKFILIGVIFVLPVVLTYTITVHKIFWGKTKTKEISY